MPQLAIDRLFGAATVEVGDIRCRGECRHPSGLEGSSATRLIFPYRGVFVRHVGRAEANQLLFFNAHEEYRVSRPVEGVTLRSSSSNAARST